MNFYYSIGIKQQPISQILVAFQLLVSFFRTTLLRIHWVYVHNVFFFHDFY